jgi:aminoglycoside phosphotransferase (APT) family kinase protein
MPEQQSPTQASIMADLLHLFRREIAVTLRPELSSPYALYTAEVMEQMLGHMEDWAAGNLHPETDAARAALIAKSPTLPPTGSHLIPEFDDGAAIDDTLAQAIIHANKKQNLALLAELGTGAAIIDDTLYTAEAQRHETSKQDDLAFMAEIDWDVTPERFDRYASSKLGINDATKKILKIPGGHSKDTFLITLVSGAELIVRRDFPFGPVDTSAPDEFDLLSRLFAAGLPVAKPITAEYDKSFLGQPFLVVEKVAGGDAHVAGMADKKVGRYVSLELARVLADLHNMDVRQSSLPLAEGDPRAQVHAYLMRWRNWWDKHRIHPSSLGEAAFAWLERNIPAGLERTVIVHGDARPGNMLFHNGAVTALLDWEFAHIGDPAEDMQYAKGFVEPFINWDDFLAAYMAAGGQRVSDEGAKFYDVFRSLRNVICTDVAWGGFAHKKYPALKLAAQGIIYKRMLAQQLAASMRQVAW